MSEWQPVENFFEVLTKNRQKRRFLLKPLLLDFSKFSQIGPCESSRPKDSENVVLFGRASFLTGVIAAQSQQRAEKVCASSKIGNVKKKDTATILIFEARH